MCGVAGFIHLGAKRNEASIKLEAMLAPIYHRGPDDAGKWVDEDSGVALGHRRLSILDTSPAGHQPMRSSCGRFVIIFNGEIYNHLELRRNLERAGKVPLGGWRSHSDTETLLACFTAWGTDKTLKSTVGMFALALWDCHEKSLMLARDRIGEKPLYYGFQNGVFIFGSELKSLRAHPSFCGDTNWHAASVYLRLNYIPAPSSIYQGIFKLIPGTSIQINRINVERGVIPTPVPFWSLGDVAKSCAENRFKGSFSDAVDELDSLLRQSVQLQSMADVPVGAFLSGGIDSSAVVAMMQSATTSQTTTFSIGMPDAKMNESHYAAAVAKHLGTRHIAHDISASEALNLIPNLSAIWDEPFADSSQIPTYLVSRLAKQDVSVVLSGDGGDEFFLGYPHYAFYRKLWRFRQLGKLPWNTVLSAASPLTKNQRLSTGLKRARSVVAAWRQPDLQTLSFYWQSRYRQGRVPIMEQHAAAMLKFPSLSDAAATAGLWDAGTNLPDDILVKVDRAAMSNSLETRAPLLDHRIIEFAYRLPVEYKIGGGVGKKVLREVLYRYVPQRLVDRPKMGFSIPLTAWLRHELRPWVESCLAQIPDDSELFNKPMINSMWKEHLSGQKVHTEQLWGILNLLGFIK